MGPALSCFHRLASNSITTFRRLFKNLVYQYMCSMTRKQSVTSLFHIRIGRSETIRDFMKRFGSALLQLDSVRSDTTLQAVKQAIRPNTQFFDSLSLYSLLLRLMDYSKEVISTPYSRMTSWQQPRERWLVPPTVRTIVGVREKGKRSQHNRDTEQERSDGVSAHASGH